MKIPEAVAAIVDGLLEGKDREPKAPYIPKFCRSRGCVQRFGHDGDCTGPHATRCCAARNCHQPAGHPHSHPAVKPRVSRRAAILAHHRKKHA